MRTVAERDTTPGRVSMAITQAGARKQVGLGLERRVGTEQHQPAKLTGSEPFEDLAAVLAPRRDRRVPGADVGEQPEILGAAAVETARDGQAANGAERAGNRGRVLAIGLVGDQPDAAAT